MVAEKKILGVCRWLANKFDADVTLLRSLFLASVIPALGTPIVFYLILFIVKPKGGFFS